MKILLNRRLAKHVTNISFRIFLRNRNLNRGKVHTQNNLRLKHRRSIFSFIYNTKNENRRESLWEVSFSTIRLTHTNLRAAIPNTLLAERNLSRPYNLCLLPTLCKGSDGKKEQKVFRVT